MKSSPNERPDGPLDPEAAESFGFRGEDDSWLDHVAAAQESHPPGTLGEFELIEEVGRGGQGVVYRARQPRTRREVAIKLLVGGSFASESARRRFSREVESTLSVEHPGVVTIHGFEELDGVPALVMEWVDGRSATEWARGEAVRPVEEILETFAEICDAVSAAHQSGVLHRDLKPSNVLIDEAGRPRVLDFGLAKGVEDEDRLTRSGGFVGTPGYAAPEQVDGGRSDVRGDVFALGVLLYEMLTGELPYRAGEGLTAFLRAVERGELRRPSALRRGLGVEVDAILNRALAPDPGERYPSVAGLADDVRRSLANLPVSAHPPSAWYELRKLVRRNRSAALLAVSLVLALAAFSVHSANQSAVLAAERDREADARRDAEFARDRAGVEVRRAQTLLDFVTHDVFETMAGESIRGSYAIVDWLEDVSELTDVRFADDDVLAATVHSRVARTYYFNQKPAEALRETDRARSLIAAWEVREDARIRFELSYTLAEIRGLALLDLGRADEAADELSRAVQYLERVENRPPGLLDRAREAATVALVVADRPEEAAYYASSKIEEPEATRPIDSFNRNVGKVRTLALMGEQERARDLALEHLEWTARTFGADSEKTAQSLDLVGEIQLELTELDAAAEHLREALRLYFAVHGGDHPRIAMVLVNLAKTCRTAESRAEGESYLAEAIAIAERIHGPEHLTPAHYTWELARFLASHGDHAAALAPYRSALASFEQLAGADSPQARAAREALTSSRALLESSSKEPRAE